MSKEDNLSQDVPTHHPQDHSEEGLGLSLPGILNILYRGRRTIVYLTLVGVVAGVAYGIFTKPLYRSTAQVRPGIVSYSGEGAPLREWALKDVVRWFRTELYWDDMRQFEPYDQYKRAPIILADFISSGPQYMRGGDVITLTNLSTDPLVAVDVLKRAIASFNEQASQDSSSSTLQLTLGGARVRMDKIRNDIERIDGDIQRADLSIKALESEILTVEASSDRLDSELKRLQQGKAWRQRAAKKSLAEAETAKLRLAEAEGMLQKLLAAESGTGQGDSSQGDAVSQVLLQTVRRNEAALAGELLQTVNNLSAYVYASAARADTLRDAIADIDLEIASLKLKQTVDLVQKKQALLLKIEELEIQKSVDLPKNRVMLETDLQAQQVQVDMLSPIEQIGRVTVSQKPVRPRKMRALTILTFLAFMGSIFVVFALEYYRHNKDVIAASESG